VHSECRGPGHGLLFGRAAVAHEGIARYIHLGISAESTLGDIACAFR
jgi:hypothetical protein